MISGLAILILGFFLGMRHATDPDHVIAVSTIVSRAARANNANRLERGQVNIKLPSASVFTFLIALGANPMK